MRSLKYKMTQKRHLEMIQSEIGNVERKIQ